MSSEKTILVTGGAGYIGSHVCKQLKAAGYQPVVFDNLSGGHREAVQWGPLFVGDTLDKESLKKAFAEFSPVAVMHFAAFISVGESVEQPEKYFRNNFEGTLNVLNVMKENSVRDFVFSSTAAVFGEPEETPLTEKHPTRPINPYGQSKLKVEEALQNFSEEEIRWISLRYFNASGADPDGDIGEAHHPETHLIPIVLEVASGERESILVFGDDYKTPDGTCVRDYIHVTDLAQAHVLALKALENGKSSGAFNLGNQKGYSVREVISTAEKITGKKIDTIVAERRDGDPAVLVSDSRKMIEELNWKPQFNSLDQIIETAWRWHLKKPSWR